MKRILLAIVIVCPAAMWAQNARLDVKPGLWENTTAIQMSGMQMPANSMPQLTPEQMANLPPAARAQMEAMKGGAGAPQTTVTKSCVTSEELVKPLFNYGDKACTVKLTASTSSSQTIHMECTRGSNKMGGDVTVTKVDAEHMKGEIAMKPATDSSTAGTMGQNMTMKITFTKRWLGADCGDVKPFSDK